MGKSRKIKGKARRYNDTRKIGNNHAQRAGKEQKSVQPLLVFWYFYRGQSEIAHDRQNQRDVTSAADIAAVTTKSVETDTAGERAVSRTTPSMNRSGLPTIGTEVNYICRFRMYCKTESPKLIITTREPTVGLPGRKKAMAARFHVNTNQG